MSNPGHTRPGSLRPGFTRLPDGRGRMVVLMRLASGEQLRNDQILDWGVLYSTAERVDCTGRNSHLAGLRLIGGQETQSTAEGWAWVRIYEDIPATAEVQVGKLSYFTDEGGRTRAKAEFIQLSSATYTAGTPGTTTAPGASGYVLATAAATDDGALRRITREYDQTPNSPGTAEVAGPLVISYPFNHLGDASHVVASQVYEQLGTHYTPLSLNATRVVTVGGSAQTLYYIGDITPPGQRGAVLMRFTRQWANKPGTRTDYQTYAVTFPGMASTAAEYAAKTANKTRAREGFTEPVDTQLTFTYYRIADAGGDYTAESLIPRDTVQRYYVTEWGSNPKSPFDTYLNDGEDYGGFFWRPTTPTRTDYNALGTWGLVVECEVKRYLGPFFVRITRRATPL